MILLRLAQTSPRRACWLCNIWLKDSQRPLSRAGQRVRDLRKRSEGHMPEVDTVSGEAAMEVMRRNKNPAVIKEENGDSVVPLTRVAGEIMKMF